MAGAERWPIRPACEVSNAEVVICDVAALDDPDVGTVNALVRLQLTARRAGLSIRLLHASPELRELLALLGLGEVVPLCPELWLEPGGQPEQREQSRGVEERVDRDHPAG